MSSKKNVVSPYKQVNKRNQSYCGYLSVSSLSPHKAYRVWKLKHTSHDKYGEGELAFVESGLKVRNMVQLPSKYLKDLSDAQIRVFYEDIEKKKFPFLVFREKLPDGSFKINMLEYSDDVVSMWRKSEDIPEMDESIISDPGMDEWLGEQKSLEDGLDEPDDSNEVAFGSIGGDENCDVPEAPRGEKSNSETLKRKIDGPGDAQGQKKFKK